MSKTFSVKIVGGRGLNPNWKKNCPHCYSARYTVVWKFNKGNSKHVTRQCDDCFTRWDVCCKDEYDGFNGAEYDPIEHKWFPKS